MIYFQSIACSLKPPPSSESLESPIFTVGPAIYLDFEGLNLFAVFLIGESLPLASSRMWSLKEMGSSGDPGDAELEESYRSLTGELWSR